MIRPIFMQKERSTFMANPAAIKAALLALETLKDEKKRRTAMIIIMTPIISLLLIIALIVHIITSPLGMFASWLLPDELKVFEEFQKDYGYNQTVGIYEDDYIDGYGQNYEGIIFADGETQVVYYNQLDERWANQLYGTDKIGTHGCGPTAMSIVISSLTGVDIDPITMSKWSYDNGYYATGNGSYHSLIPNAAESFGLTCEGIGKDNPQEIVDALASGKLVVALMSKGHFTSGGHYIVLRGVTADGKILVADPASYKRSEKEWKFDIIVDESRNGAAAGGPFWVIS